MALLGHTELCLKGVQKRQHAPLWPVYMTTTRLTLTPPSTMLLPSDRWQSRACRGWAPFLTLPQLPLAVVPTTGLLTSTPLPACLLPWAYQARAAYCLSEWKGNDMVLCATNGHVMILLKSFQPEYYLLAWIVNHTHIQLCSSKRL